MYLENKIVFSEKDQKLCENLALLLQISMDLFL